jgi:hypothetical protein
LQCTRRFVEAWLCSERERRLASSGDGRRTPSKKKEKNVFSEQAQLDSVKEVEKEKGWGE